MPDIKAQNETALASVKAIYDAADEANTLLDGMQTAATQAGTTLNGIYATAVQAEESASSAQASADSASEYASRALGNLASVQSVTETLNWITAHGTMTLTSDTALDPSHVYFVVDANGDYIVGGTHYSVVSEPVLADIGSYYELSINESLNNYVATHLVVDTEGLWIIPDAGGNKVLIATGSGSTYTTAGTYIINGSTVLASFTANGIQVGQTGESHLTMSHNSMELVDKAGTSYLGVIDNETVEEVTQTVEDFESNIFGTKYPIYQVLRLAIDGVETSDYSYTKGASTIGVFDTIPSSPVTLSATYTTVALGKYYDFGYRKSGYSEGKLSVIEGLNNVAQGDYSHAEGNNTYASGENAHAEGSNTFAQGKGSHAEGFLTYATGLYSHAEGLRTHATGYDSHAEGDSTLAQGSDSHAQNKGTIASQDYQTALGKYNIEDTNGDYAIIVGNGTNGTARSNALIVDWGGDVCMALDTTATSGTDKEIYDALVSLGWDSDVIV